MSIHPASNFSGKPAEPSLRKRAMRGLIGILLAAGLLGAAPAASQANAYGYQYWAAAWTGGIKIIPSGQLFHGIEGNGRFITADGANYITGGALCDTAVRFTYGYGKQWVWSHTRWGCSPVRAWKYAMNRTVPYGHACAELYANNRHRYITKQCHLVR